MKPLLSAIELNASLSRRHLMAGAVTLGAGLAMANTARTDDAARPIRQRNGRIHHSLVNWCYASYFSSVAEFCQVAANLGCESIELIDPEHWPTLRDHGLTCAIAGSHGFPVGFNNPSEWDECTSRIKERVDQCVEFGVERIITFTGMANGISREDGANNCVEGLKPSVAYAEEKGVTLCLEMLNTRDDSHPMKGHPGYQGDHTEYCIDIIQRVGSPRLKLLFDVYHVQIMDGDVIRRLHQHQDYIGHIHTAGNPGRGELDDAQEINYPAVMQALVDTGYEGFVGHEFIPTTDPLEGLSQAVAWCDV